MTETSAPAARPTCKECGSEMLGDIPFPQGAHGPFCTDCAVANKVIEEWLAKPYDPEASAAKGRQIDAALAGLWHRRRAS
jgi:hypothetical protein